MRVKCTDRRTVGTKNPGCCREVVINYREVAVSGGSTVFSIVSALQCNVYISRDNLTVGKPSYNRSPTVNALFCGSPKAPVVT